MCLMTRRNSNDYTEIENENNKWIIHDINFQTKPYEFIYKFNAKYFFVCNRINQRAQNTLWTVRCNNMVVMLVIQKLL